MLAVTHATAFGLRVNRFGPLAGGARQPSDRVDELKRAQISGAQEYLRHVNREVRVDAAVNHVLEKASIKKAVLQKVSCCFQNSSFCGREKLQRKISDKRSNG